MKKIVILLLCSMASCCKMVNGTHQAITIQNLPKDAVVVVSDDHSSKIALSDSLNLARSSPYTVHIHKPGHISQEIEVYRALSPLVISYALPGGAIMLAVDAESSSQFNLHPANIVADLTPREEWEYSTQTIRQEEIKTTALLNYRSIIRATRG